VYYADSFFTSGLPAWGLGDRRIEGDLGTGRFRLPPAPSPDEGVCEALVIVIDTSITSGRDVRALEQVSRWQGIPRANRCDNGLVHGTRKEGVAQSRSGKDLRCAPLPRHSWTSPQLPLWRPK